MIAFVGLGNIGSHYANTKHNFGFWVVDEFAHRQHLSFQPGKGDYVYAESSEKDVLLVKPTSGMNVSGIPVKDVLSRWELDLKNLHLIVDDVDLPLGSMRIRPHGGDGCHRGLESVIYHLRSTDFLGLGWESRHQRICDRLKIMCLSRSARMISNRLKR